jgi:hypothetical protein
MKRFIVKFGLATLLAVSMTGTPVALRAQPATNAVSHAPQIKLANQVIPFHGALKAIDNTAKTISVGTLTIQITSETHISKLGKPATLAEGVEGEIVAGAYKKEADGKLNAVSLRFGPKPPPPTPDASGTNANKTAKP